MGAFIRGCGDADVRELNGQERPKNLSLIIAVNAKNTHC